VIDIGRGVQLCSDHHAYNAYLRRFVDSYGDAVGVLHASLADDDRAAAAALAHKLAGVAGNLALPDTHKLAGVLELVLATANDPTPALKDLRIALAQAVAAIEQFALPAALLRPEPLASMQPPAPLQRLLCDLMAALDGDDPEPAEPVLAALAHHLSKEQLQSIVRCVCEFDFRGAEAGVTRLAKELDFTLGK
jgi:HPt (histidine-containing phosphotransfer) domain-containing protein